MVAAVEGLKIGVGTKIEDVYGDKQAFEQARLADNNGDKVIDDDELKRFIGPLWVEENTPIVSCNSPQHRALLAEYPITGKLVCSIPGEKFASEQLIDNEPVYYPGLTLDKVNGDKKLKTFENIDIDKSKSLSAEEIKLYGKKKEVQDLKKQKKTLINEEHEQGVVLGVGIAGLLGLTLGMGGDMVVGGMAMLFGGITVMVGFPFALMVCYALCKIIPCTYKKNKCAKQLQELKTQVEKETADILEKAKKPQETK